MDLDDLVCYCYRVSLRKLINYARRERPLRASQMSECLGAGTGCGWCIPTLKRIHACVLADQPVLIDEPAERYAESRKHYIRERQPRNTF